MTVLFISYYSTIVTAVFGCLPTEPQMMWLMLVMGNSFSLVVSPVIKLSFICLCFMSTQLCVALKDKSFKNNLKSHRQDGSSAIKVCKDTLPTRFHSFSERKLLGFPFLTLDLIFTFLRRKDVGWRTQDSDFGDLFNVQAAHCSIALGVQDSPHFFVVYAR